jgi:hypothetical protein
MNDPLEIQRNHRCVFTSFLRVRSCHFSPKYVQTYCSSCDNLIRVFIQSQKTKKFQEIIVGFFMSLNLSFLRLHTTYLQSQILH